MKTSNHPFLARLISKWASRAKQAKKSNAEIAILSELTPEHFSRIINKHIVNTRLSTISKVEEVLHSLGV